MKARQGESELLKAIQTNGGLKYASGALSFFSGQTRKEASI
jgi:hypothetical protein